MDNDPVEVSCYMIRNQSFDLDDENSNGCNDETFTPKDEYMDSVEIKFDTTASSSLNEQNLHSYHKLDIQGNSLKNIAIPNNFL